MPTIAIFYGIVIRMYWRAQRTTHPCHLPRLCGGYLPTNALKIVRRWVFLRRIELKRNWLRGKRREPFLQIAGPDEIE
jgi:hypothetical protein